MNATETNLINEITSLRKENEELKQRVRMYEKLSNKLNKMYVELRQKLSALLSNR